jgi:hypothetical protein
MIAIGSFLFVNVVQSTHFWTTVVSVCYDDDCFDSGEQEPIKFEVEDKVISTNPTFPNNENTVAGICHRISYSLTFRRSSAL